MRGFILGGFACGLLLTPVEAKQVELMNKDGKSISVELLSSSKSDVTVKLLDGGRTLTIPLKSLDAASKQSIKDWKKGGVVSSHDFSITARVKKDIDRGNSKGNKVPPTKLSIGGSVKVTNDHDSFSSEPVTVYIALLGRSVAKTGLNYIFDLRSQKVAALEPGAAKEIKLRNLKTTYLDDKDKSYGAKYSGYLIYVSDKQGEILAGKSVPNGLFEKHKEQLQGLKKDAFYDRDWQRVAFKDKHPKNKKK